MGSTMSKIVMPLFGMFILYLITRNLWLTYGRTIPQFGITETVVVLAVVIFSCFTLKQRY